jgi:tetratricopeptide (TPR) repeat protein
MAGLVGGYFMLRDGDSSAGRPVAVQPAPASAPASRDTPPVGPAPKAVPQTETVPRDAANAEEQYRLALAWLRRGDPDQARRSLEEVIRKHPASPYARRAQEQLDRLPPSASSAAAQRERALAELRERLRQESSEGKKHAPITEEDIRGLSKTPGDMKGPRVAPAPAAEPAPQNPGNQLSLLSAATENGQLILRVSYHLAAEHPRPVHAAARVAYPAGNSLFAYGAETLSRGSGQTIIALRLNVPVETQRPASIRLMLFESQGPMFFSVTVPYP